MLLMWRVRDTDGVVCVCLDELNDRSGIVAGFSTRLGGVSAAPFETLNIGLHVGDKSEHVLENRKRLARAIGMGLRSMVFADQVHSGTVREVSALDRGRGAYRRDDAVAATDGLMTASRGVVLVMTYADCVPVLLFAPSVPAVAVVHAGWRGTASSIAATAVSLMSRSYKIDCSHIHAVVGPSIGACCYQVASDVAEEVRKAARCVDQHLSSGDIPVRTGAGEARTSLDLSSENVSQLVAAGVPVPNIVHVDTCTSCSKDLFYSHRAEGGRTGRFAAFAYIPPPVYNRTGEEVTEIGVGF